MRTSPVRADGVTHPPPPPVLVCPSLVQQTLKKLGPLMVNGDVVARLLADPGTEPRAVTTAIEMCPGLSARLMSAMNSAVFGEPWRDCSVGRAVAMLGARRSRTFALAYALRNATRPGVISGTMAQTLRFSSLHKACVARLFCRVTAPACADVAFDLGLIQDIGLPLLVGADPEFYASLVIDGLTEGWSEEERRRFGLSHATVGQELLLSWHADDKLQQAVLLHHKPPMADAADSDLLLTQAVRLAGLMPHLGEPMGPGARERVEEVYARYLRVHYESVDTFLTTTAAEARGLLAGCKRVDVQALLPKLIAAVTGEAINNTTRLAKAEQAIEGQRQNFTQLREQAYTDGLTRLLNRRGFLELAERRVNDEAQVGRGVCCFSFDLDGLKKVNDTHGHEVGDKLLRGFAKLLRRCFDGDDLIARFGGDEYAVICADVDEPIARKVADRINAQLQRARLRLRADLEVDVGCSIGAAFHDRALGPVDVADLLSHADHVMYQKKHSGKGGLAFERFVPPKPLDAGGSGVPIPFSGGSRPDRRPPDTILHVPPLA